ncbi:hypothetical protein BaRGS_00006218, partial [Batillaria attramentaria]
GVHGDISCRNERGGRANDVRHSLLTSTEVTRGVTASLMLSSELNHGMWGRFGFALYGLIVLHPHNDMRKSNASHISRIARFSHFVVGLFTSVSSSSSHSRACLSDSESEEPAADMLPRKRPRGRNFMSPPTSPPKRSRFASPRGGHPLPFDRHPPRYSSSSDDMIDMDLPPPPPFPFLDPYLPRPPPVFEDDYPPPPPPLRPRHRHHHHSHRSRTPPRRRHHLHLEQSTGSPSLDEYGHLERQEKSRPQRLSSTASSGYASDHAPPRDHHSTSRGRKSSGEGGSIHSPGGRGRGKGGPPGAFLGGTGTEDKWSKLFQGQGSTRGQGHSRGQGLNRGQGPARGQASNRGQFSARGQGHGSQQVMKHKPLPPAKASNALCMMQTHKGVHSMAAVSKPDTSSMSLVEKLFRFMVYLRNETPRVNDIQTVENAITGCHLDLKTTYESEEVGNYQNRRIFSGRLLINDVFLARAVGQTKKELKHECYKLALEVLKTKDVGQILQQKDVGIEAIRQTFEECSKKPDAGKPDGAQAEAATAKLATAAPIAVAVETVATPEERWSEFITYVRGNASQAINAISRIEMALSGSRCGLDRAYSDCALQVTVKPMFQGSLMIGGILQAQAEGFKKKEAKQKTYELAVERFTTLELAEILKGVEPK